MNIIADIFAIVNTVVFIILSFVHIYWAFGGKRYSDRVIPEKLSGEKEFIPGVFATIIVAFGLLLFALFTINSFSLWFEPAYSNYAFGFIAVVFCLRSMGDFKYVGFTKKVKGTLFAEYDTKFYSPLSLYLGCSSFLILLFHLTHH